MDQGGKCKCANAASPRAKVQMWETIQLVDRLISWPVDQLASWQERGEAARGHVGKLTRGQGAHARGPEARWTRGRNQALRNRREGDVYAQQMRSCAASGRPFEIIVESDGLTYRLRSVGVQRAAEGRCVVFTILGVRIFLNF